MGHKKRPTEEEYKEKKTKILELFKQGYPMRRIQVILDITPYYLKKIRDELINDGLITTEELKCAFDRYMAENPAAQGLDKRRVRVKSDTVKAEERHNRSLVRKEKTLELILAGKNVSEIARELQVSETGITWYIKQLKEEGKLEGIEIAKGSQDKTNIERLDRTSPEYYAKREEILKYLRLGWKTGAIRKKLNITPYYINIYLDDVKYKGLITPLEIEEARRNKKQQDIKDLAEHIQAGYSLDYFRKLHPEFTYNEVTPLIKELIESEKLTREQIDENRKNAARKTKNKNAQMSPDEQVAFILDKVKKGYTPQEILLADKTKSLTMHKVLYQKRRIIAQGIISQEEADNAMEKRQNVRVKKRQEKAIDKILEYTRLGYDLHEMSEMIGYSYSYIVALRQRYKKEHEWFTDEELKEFKRQRKIREYEALPQEEKDRIEKEKQDAETRLAIEKAQREAEVLAKRRERKDHTKVDHQKKIDIIKKYALNGKTAAEIAMLMNISKEFVYALQYESQRNGTWLSEDEIKKVKQKRNSRRKYATKKRHKEKEKQKELKRIQGQQEEEQRKMQELWKLRELAINGLSNDEIAKQMHYSTSHITVLKRRAKELGIWFSKEDIEFYREQRAKEQAELEAAKQKAEQERRDRERREAERAIKEEEEAIKRLQREQRKKIQAYAEEYKSKKKLAKMEYKQEYDGKENVSIDGRREFIELLIKLFEMEAKISQEDINLVLDTIYLHHEFVKTKYLKFLILYSAKTGGYPEAIKMTTALEKELSDTKFHKPLYQYRQWIKSRITLEKIKTYKEQGWSNTKIGEKFNMTSAEVVVLLDSEGKKVDFFEDDRSR